MCTLRRTLQVLTTFVALFATPVFGQEETVDWLDNYEKAKEEARRTNKPIFLEFRCEA